MAPALQFHKEERDGVSGVVVRGLSHEAWLRLAQEPDGRLRCTEIRLRAEPSREITRRGLRAIPLGSMVDTIASIAARATPTVKAPTAAAAPKSFGWYGELSDLWHEMDQVPRPRRSVITDELLDKLAAAYLKEVKAGNRSPIKTLASLRWPAGHSPANLRRLLRMARQRGRLGRSIHGKAGERPIGKAKVRRKSR